MIKARVSLRRTCGVLKHKRAIAVTQILIQGEDVERTSEGGCQSETPHTLYLVICCDLVKYVK